MAQVRYFQISSVILEIIDIKIFVTIIIIIFHIYAVFRLMVLAELLSLTLYLISLAVLHEYFGKFQHTSSYNLFISEFKMDKLYKYSSILDWEFISSYAFMWKVFIITVVSCLPLYIIKFLRKKCSPPSYLKLS